MNYHILLKLKKYILFISIILFILTWSHIFYRYLIYDAASEAIEGGTISEAIVGSFPHFNPLLPSNDHNSYINGLLYRSLLRYDQETKQFSSDLANCNIERLWNIECILEENIRWSDGKSITADDVIATYDIIRQTKVHPLYASLLENVSIRKNGNVLSFTSGTQDINLLSLFLQPILPKSIVDTLNAETVEGKLSDINGVFSWMFSVSNIIVDETTGITRITLERNPSYALNPTYIEYLIINLFRDETHLLQNRSSSFNIKYDKNRLIGNTIPRLVAYDFTVPQFSAIFYNTKNLERNLRSYLNNTIERESLINTLGDQKVEAVYNPFFSERLIDTAMESSFSFESYLASKWYYSKAELLRQKNERVRISQETDLFSEVLVQDTRPVQEELNIIQSPTKQKYNFVSSDNILIEWRVPAWVSSVIVNDYELQGFSEGDNVFFYRLLKNFDSIVDWENKYDVYFVINGEKIFQESFHYYLNEDEEELSIYESQFFQESIQENNTASQNTKLEDLLEIEMTLEQIESLAAGMYYTTSWEAYTLKIISVQTDILLSEALQIIARNMREAWIELEIESMSLWELTAWLRSNTMNYDMILLGIDLWYFSGNIYPYFHSTQVENGYNFSKFSELWFDILLEQLRTEILSPEKEAEIQEKILAILEKEQIMLTLYTNKQSLLLDRNIRKNDIPSKLSNTQARQFIFHDMYFNESRKIQWENKSIIWWLRFIVSSLF